MVRHAQSTWNVEHRFTGQADPPLSPLGQVQAGDLAARCAGLGLDAVVSSDLSRAAATARAVAAAAGLRGPEPLPGLRERWHRVWQGLTRDQIEARFPGGLDAWREARALPLPVAGETDEPYEQYEQYEPYERFRDRVIEGLVTATRYGDRVLVVAHAGIFVVLDQLSGQTSAGSVGNAEGRLVAVGADRALTVGRAIKLDAAHRSGAQDP